MRDIRLLVPCVVVVVLLALTGCVPRAAGGAPEPELHGQWELDSAQDPAGIIDLTGTHITLTIERDATTGGRASCDFYAASVLGDSGHLHIAVRVADAGIKRSCALPRLASVQRRYFDALSQVVAASVAGGVLDLRGPGILLRYVRALTRSLDGLTSIPWALQTVVTDAAPPFQPELTGAGIVFSTNGHLHGSTGCRSFTADYAQNAGEIVVTKLRYNTPIPCQGVSEKVDVAFLTPLQGAFLFQAGTEILTIADLRGGVELSFQSPYAFH